MKELVGLVAALTLLVGCGGGADDATSSPGTPLSGTIRIEPGACTAGGASGSYFRMISVGGTVAKGPFFQNPDSPCADKSFGIQKAGTDGGIRLGNYQPGPAQRFDARGNARASAIVAPNSFTAIDFAILTAKADPQSGTRVPAPALRVDPRGRVTGQLTAWTAAWNNLYFNQGSPKPDGSRPGLTAPVTGTYDAASGRIVLSWVSQIVGGPFNGFAGAWHLEGTLVKGS